MKGHIFVPFILEIEIILLYLYCNDDETLVKNKEYENSKRSY